MKIYKIKSLSIFFMSLLVVVVASLFLVPKTKAASRDLISSSGLYDQANWTKTNAEFDSSQDSALITRASNGSDFNTSGSLSYHYSVANNTNWESSTAEIIENDHHELNRMFSIVLTHSWPDDVLTRGDSYVVEYGLDGSVVKKWVVGNLPLVVIAGNNNDVWVLNGTPDPDWVFAAGKRNTNYDNTVMHLNLQNETMQFEPLPDTGNFGFRPWDAYAIDKYSRLWIKADAVIKIFDLSTFSSSGTLTPIEIIPFAGQTRKMIFDNLNGDNLYLYDVGDYYYSQNTSTHIGIYRLHFSNFKNLDYSLDHYAINSANEGIMADFNTDKYGNFWFETIIGGFVGTGNIYRISHATGQMKKISPKPTLYYASHIDNVHQFYLSGHADSTSLGFDISDDDIIVSGSSFDVSAIATNQIINNDTENPSFSSITEHPSEGTFIRADYSNCYIDDHRYNGLWDALQTSYDGLMLDNSGNAWQFTDYSPWMGVDKIEPYTCALKWNTNTTSLVQAYDGGVSSGNSMYKDSNTIGINATMSKHSSNNSVRIKYSNNPITSSNPGVTDITQVADGKNLYVKIDLEGSKYLSPEVKSLRINYSSEASPTLIAALAASPNSGNVPLTTTLTASRTGTAVGTINYSFWWNCNNQSASLDDTIKACGDPTDSAIGIKFNNLAADKTSKSVPHTYSSVLSYQPKVIIEQGAVLSSAATTIVNVQNPPCAPLADQTRTISCPAGQTGIISQIRRSTCPGPTWGEWTTITNTCVVRPPSTSSNINFIQDTRPESAWPPGFRDLTPLSSKSK